MRWSKEYLKYRTGYDPVAPRDPVDLWREMAGNSRAHVSKPPKSFAVGADGVGGGDTATRVMGTKR